ncbi:J domain-containing protein [Haloplanus sp. C73]|uniref:J domain-containing protein n=1 Tax=Haloplanus sp. C73 TaxID=3421641 RepID=UPI003EBBBBCC
MSQIDWPAGWERTPARQRTKNRNYEVELQQAIEDLEAELDRLGVDDWRLSTAMDHQSRNPNYPYANQPEPNDPGVVVRWSMDGEQYAVACDAYSRVRDNLRTAGLYIREKRKMSNRPVTTGETEFANARLPSGDGDTVAAEAPPHEILEVAEDAPDAVVRDAYRARVQEAHPDKGGSREQFERVQRAREAMLDDE